MRKLLYLAITTVFCCGAYAQIGVRLNSIQDPFSTYIFYDTVQVAQVEYYYIDETNSYYTQPRLFFKSSPSGDTLMLRKDPNMQALQISGGISFKDIPNGFASTSISGSNDTICFHFNATTKGVKIYQGFMLVGGNVQVSQASPAQLTADSNNFNISYNGSLRLSTNASHNITGFNGGADGRILYIQNVGSQNIVFKNKTSSVSANQIITGSGGDLTVAADASCTFIYDATTAMWRRQQ